MHELETPLTPEILLRAYTIGIFPMAEGRDQADIFWVDPKRRGVMPLDGFHISRSLARRMRKSAYSIEINKNFSEVVEACADREETWINGAISSLYLDLHRMGHAHSFEISISDQLIGGVYGVAIGGAFFGESMFSRTTDGSKLALAHLVDHLRACEFTLFDTQFITPHLESLGAIEISRSAYHSRLDDALKVNADFQALPVCQDAQLVLHRSTQTS